MYRFRTIFFRFLLVLLRCGAMGDGISYLLLRARVVVFCVLARFCPAAYILEFLVQGNSESLSLLRTVYRIPIIVRSFAQPLPQGTNLNYGSRTGGYEMRRTHMGECQSTIQSINHSWRVQHGCIPLPRCHNVGGE